MIQKHKRNHLKTFILIFFFLCPILVEHTSYATQCAYFGSKTYEHAMLFIPKTSVIMRGTVTSEIMVNVAYPNSHKKYPEYTFEVTEYLTEKMPNKTWKARGNISFIMPSVRLPLNKEITHEFILHNNELFVSSNCSRFAMSNTGFKHLDYTELSQIQAQDWFKWKEIISKNEEHFIVKNNNKNIIYESFPVNENNEPLTNQEKTNRRQIKEYDSENTLCYSIIYDTNTMRIFENKQYLEVCYN